MESGRERWTRGSDSYLPLDTVAGSPAPKIIPSNVSPPIGEDDAPHPLSITLPLSPRSMHRMHGKGDRMWTSLPSRSTLSPDSEGAFVDMPASGSLRGSIKALQEGLEGMLGETPDGAPAPSRPETAKSLAIGGLYPAKHTKIPRGSVSSIAESNSNAIILDARAFVADSVCSSAYYRWTSVEAMFELRGRDDSSGFGVRECDRCIREPSTVLVFYDNRGESLRQPFERHVTQMIQTYGSYRPCYPPSGSAGEASILRALGSHPELDAVAAFDSSRGAHRCRPMTQRLHEAGEESRRLRKMGMRPDEGRVTWEARLQR